jgi:hypothetical protein
MTDYNLQGLSPRSFERLVQALTVKHLGMGVTVFGDGPDGGREATFEGTLTTPEGHTWTGYAVIQAKFRQRVVDSNDDQEWLIGQLAKELKGYVERPKRKRPRYLIVATNVVLSAVSESGGKDRLGALLTQYSGELGIVEFMIWDYDQICSMLDGAADIRRAYAAFITAGDVLAAVLDMFGPEADSFRDVLTNYVSKEFLASQYAKLEEAGYAGEERIALSRVFIDLPIHDVRHVDPPDDDDENVTMFLQQVASLSSERFDPDSIAAGADAAGSRADPKELRGRIVIIGGPGQGKSTLSQFLCQLFRAAILKSVPEPRLSPEVQNVLRMITGCCADEGLVLPEARRFPVQVVLGEFAAAVSRRNAALQAGSETQPLTLLSFIIERISSRTGLAVSPHLFRRWLAAYPWLLVFDGLDEVPSSSNRDEVLRLISDFWVDAAQVNADLLIVATTRPQGYGGEFSPMHFQHAWLTPLRESDALRYAERLLKARYGADTDRRAKVLSRLEEAASLQATARLMRSPLQVTIMATLLDQIGRAPQDRWRLFHEYYQTIYRREMERDTPIAPLLSRFRSDIDSIHYAVAWELQVESERSGGTDARLAVKRFRAIVRTRLLDKGFETADLLALEAQLQEAVENRLVFLVSPEANVVGFEIRSLQEFMAAQYLMNGATSSVQERLRGIAPAAAWRNVLLFAAGRCFATDEHLRDTIHTVCVDLNHELGGRVGATIKAGSRLALDILEDGLADRQPKYARLIAACALALSEGPVHFDQVRLADVWSSRLDEVYRAVLVRRAELRPLDYGSWSVVLALAGRGVSWARELMSTLQSAKAAEIRQLIEIAVGSGNTSSILPLAVEYTIATGDIVYTTIGIDDSTVMPDIPPWLHGVMRHFWRHGMLSEGMSVLAGDTPIVHLALTTLAGSKEAGLGNAYRTAPDTSEWRWLRYAGDFIHEPSITALAAFIEMFPRNYQARYWSRSLPWPLAAVANWLQTASDDVIRGLVLGDLGGPEDWITSEELWLSSGVQLSELASRNIGVPFIPNVPAGIPVIRTITQREARSEHAHEAVRLLSNTIAITPDPIVRNEFARWAIEILNVPRSWEPTSSDAQMLRRIAESLLDDSFVDASFLAQLPMLNVDADILDALDLFGRKTNLWTAGVPDWLNEFLYAKDLLNTRGGLMRIAAHGVAQRYHASKRGQWRFLAHMPSVDAVENVDNVREQALLIFHCARGAEQRDATEVARRILRNDDAMGRTLSLCGGAIQVMEAYTPAMDDLYLAIVAAATDVHAQQLAYGTLAQSFSRRRADLEAFSV